MLGSVSRNKSEVKEALSLADIIYVGGGNTFYLLEHMNKCDFKTLLLDKLAKGALYIGSSAGSIICCPDINFIAPMDDPSKANLANTAALDLVPFFFLPHLNHSFQSKIAQEIVANYKDDTPLIALNDEQFIHIKNIFCALL